MSRAVRRPRPRHHKARQGSACFGFAASSLLDPRRAFLSDLQAPASFIPSPCYDMRSDS